MARTVEDAQDDYDAVYSARLSFLTTGAVKEVGRAGRKLVKDNPKLEDFDKALAALRLEIDGLTAAAAGTRRRRALSVNFG